MTFEEWWEQQQAFTDEYKIPCELAWEAGIQEGIDRMYKLYDICPHCKLPNGQHKPDCTRV